MQKIGLPIILLLTSLLSGCGYRGALYLPADTPSATTAHQSQPQHQHNNDHQTPTAT